MHKIYKCMFLAMIFGLCQQSFAYNIYIHNNTDSQVRVDIKLAATNEQRNKFLAPNSSDVIESAGWCIDSVTTVGTGGNLSGKSAGPNQPPSTGFGIACKNFTLNIRQTADSHIINDMN